MLREVQWSEDRTYRTASESEPIKFYLYGLCNSNKLDLLLGYFSSAAINILSLGFATFLNSGGIVRLVINNVLSQQDADAITLAREGDFRKDAFDLRDISSLKNILNNYGRHFFECLAWLIANDRIQVVIIQPKGRNGIAHYKSGSFYDGTNTVSFKASCNFTAYGLLENLEELECDLSWEYGATKIASRNKHFDLIFSGKADFVEYVEAKDIEIAIKNEFGNKHLNELIIQENELIEKKKLILNNLSLNNSSQESDNQFEDLITKPKFPFPEGPRSYQIKAYDNWVENNYQGLFAMATGTGKTITALNCVLQEYLANQTYKFIVLVPTIALATQWEKEIINKFNFNEVTVCSTLNNEWEISVRRYGRNIRLGSDFNFCILIIYASFRGKRFQSIFKDLFTKNLNDVILIADEAHTLGSEKLLSVLPNGIKKRIGLSATPERQYDEEGGATLSKFFNSAPPFYTFSYDMKQAINDNVLCKYFYYPKIVELTTEELIAYKEYTKKLSAFLDSNTGRYKEDPYVNNLLIRRKNIIHKAKNKLKCLTSIIDSIGKNNFNYAFIYVPEGFEPNYAEEDIDQTTNNDDNSIIQNYTKALYEKYGFKLRKFTGETHNRDEILQQFSEGKLNALVAMKCLDEGVDIPQTQYAIFCSSTGNPRQYIQRRGRVLRYHNNKENAHIFDMIIKPIIEVTDINPDQIKTERNILIAELRRLINFAVLAENKDACLSEIEELCYNLGIDIYDMANKEEEKYKHYNQL